jgi:hypothetical protein
MGEVYRAVDERLGRNVALKLLPPARTNEVKSQARLVREAQAASNLNHPGIVTVHDVGIWDSRVYFVMELVEGERFSEIIARGVEPARAVALCAQAAEALGVAHRRGILHRDIKPDNLMVTAEGRVKVLDFGLAKLRASDEPNPEADEAASRNSLEALMPTEVIPETPRAPARPSEPPPLGDTLLSEERPRRNSWPAPPATADEMLTEADTLLGTPVYMSPEQAQRRPLDARSEVYSLGLVLYELLTKTRPLVRGTLEETLAAAAEADLPPIEPGPNVPRSIAPILKRALARDPDARYRDMNDFAKALASANTARPVWRRTWVLASLGLGGVALATTALVVGKSDPPARPEFVIGSARPITAEAGCEEFPSFTPDGREVVFDGIYQGDYEIQAISVAGGVPRRLTRTPGWDIGAEVSRDGKHVAYVHFGPGGRELRVLPIEGDTAAPARVIGAIRGFPIWAHDGALLYADDAGTVWRTTLDGKPAAFARLPTDHIAPYLDQYRDGELVVATKSRADTSPHVVIGHARAGESVRAASPEWKVIDSAHIRVDDRYDGLFFVKATISGALRVHWRSRRGGEEIVLDRIDSVANSFAISQRRDRLVYSSCSTQTMVGRLAGGKLAPLPAVSADWDPDGFAVLDHEHVILSTARSGSASRLWRVSTAGKADLLVDQPAAEPAVSPDRTRIAWRGIGVGAEGIYVRAIGGGTITRLSDRSDDSRPRFSHDGRQVLFLRAEPGGRVHAVPVTGGTSTPVTPGGVIAFASAQTVDRLAIISSDANTRTVAVGPSGGPYKPMRLEQRAYSAVVFTADGSKLLVTPDPSSLLEIDPTGQAPPRVVFWSAHETVHQFSATPDGVWALVSSDEGDVIVVEGRF